MTAKPSRILEWIKTLEAPDSSQHMEAAIQLIETGASAVDALTAALSSEDGQVRYLAAWILGEIGDERAVPALIACLHDQDQRVQNWSAKALGEIGDTRAVEPLMTALFSSSAESRRNAAAALGWLGSTAPGGMLVDLLKDPHPEVRSTVAESLGKIQYQRAAVPLAFSLQHDEDAWVRLRAAFALGEIGGPIAEEALLRALDDPHERVRYNAALALGSLHSTNAIDSLCQRLIADPSPAARRGIAVALGYIGDERAVEALVAALIEQDDMVLEAIDRALQLLGYTIE